MWKDKREHPAESHAPGLRTGVKLDELGDLAGLQVDADGVVHLDEGVWVADGAGIMGHQVGDSLGADDDLLDLAQLVLQRKRRETLTSNEYVCTMQVQL